ncbi:MAG: hypothetical protein ACO2OZ_12565 [Acidilobaceae archaeon]
MLWVVYSDPSTGDDMASATCALGGSLLVFGFDSRPGDYQFRVEFRNVSTGAPLYVWSWNPSGFNDVILDCDVLDGRAYAVGATLTLEKPKAYAVTGFDPRFNVEVRDLDWSGFAYTVEAKDGYLYVGGGDLRESRLVFRVDKLDASLGLVASYKSAGLEGHHAGAFDMVFNKATGHLWAVGTAAGDKGDRWWIEVIDPQAMELVKVIDPGVRGVAMTAISDSEGFVYVMGIEGTGRGGYLLKFDREGNVVARLELGEFTATKATMIGDFLVLAGDERRGGYYRHTIYVLDRDLNILGKTYLSMDVDADSYFAVGRMWVDGSKVYVAGWDMRPGNARWVVYALEAREVMQTTVTTTVTTTVIRFLTYTTTVTETRLRTVTTTQPVTTTVYVTTTQVREETATVTVREPITVTLTRDVTRTLTNTVTETKMIEREVVREHTITLTTTIERLPTTPVVALVIALTLIAVVALLMLRRR